MTTPLSLRSYRCSARALGAKSAGTLALSLGALALAAHAAEPGITVTTPGSDNVGTAGTPSNAVYFSLFGGQVSTSGFGTSDGYLWTASDPGGDYIDSYIVGANGSGILFAGEATGDPTAPNAHLFAAHDSIQSGSGWNFRAFFNQFEYGTPGLAPGWAGTTGYVGLKLPAVGGYYYGWAKVTTNADASIVTLDSFAINGLANAPIAAGQTTAVPEPAISAALLALGAAGLVAYRRRKHLQRAAA